MVGAGPAGGQLARRLARRGVDVALVDRLPDLRQAAFSSAAVPLETVQRFGLPASVLASPWSGWRLIGPGERRRDWQASSPLGAVLDFGALRHWLAEECRRAGGGVYLGRTAVHSHPQGHRMATRLRGPGGREETILSDWVVDASGERRALLGAEPQAGAADRSDPLISAVGVEWLVQVPFDTWNHWRDRLSFCLGSDWVPQGYGWVFPMQEGVLKIGICRVCDPGLGQPPLGLLQERLLERLLETENLRGAIRVLDRHGGRVRSRIHRREPHRKGRLLGLGDVVSTANLLGGEGIRHAFTCSAVLEPLLLKALAQADGARAERVLDRYPRLLRRALGWRWSLSGRIARRTWFGLHDGVGDRRLLRILTSLEGCRAEDLSALLFGYRFERYGLRILPYALGWR